MKTIILLFLALGITKTYASSLCALKVSSGPDRESLLNGLYGLGNEKKIDYRTYTFVLLKNGKVLESEDFETALEDGMIPTQKKRGLKSWSRDCEKVKKNLLKKAEKGDCDNAAVYEITRLDCRPRLNF